MNKLTIKKIVEFRSKKSERSKKTFATKLKVDVEKVSGDPRNYWNGCLSAIRVAYKLNDLSVIKAKIDVIEGRLEGVENKRTILQYQSNIDVLHNFEDFDLKKVKPSGKILLLKKHSSDFILNLFGLDVEAKPCYVFSFEYKGIQQVGAIWFIAQKGGFSKGDLGMFADILYKYLETHYSASYTVSPRYCMAIDVFNNTQVNYAQIQKGEIEAALKPTLFEIKKLM